MNRSIVGLTAAVWLAASPVQAQEQTREGVAVGDNTVLNTRAGVESGYVTNVFFEEDAGGTVGAALLRVLAGLSIESISSEGRAGRNGGEASGYSGRVLDYQIGADFSYNEFFSDNEFARDQRNIAVTAKARLTFMPERPVRFRLSNNYTRDNRPPNFEAPTTINRSINVARAELMWVPKGRTINGVFSYQNLLDIFEDDSNSFANRIQHTFGMRANWDYLPGTRFYLKGSLGIFGPLGDSELQGTVYKNSATPARAIAGVQTAISELTTAGLYAGWAAGFYDLGDSYNTATYGASFGWRYSPLGRATLRFDRQFNDSVNANFYGEYAWIARLEHQVASLLFEAEGSYRLRRYQSVPTVIMPTAESRDDNIVSWNATARYQFLKHYEAGVEYSGSVVDTDFRYMLPGGGFDDPGFNRQVFLATFRASY